MNRKTWIALIITLLLTVVSVEAYRNWSYPQTATVAPVDYTIYFEDTVWANGTAMNWGTLYPGNTYYYNLTVVSLVPSNTTVTLQHVLLPTGWIQTWDGNNTLIPPEQSVFGWLNLTVPSDAIAGDYSWDSIIKGEYT